MPCNRVHSIDSPRTSIITKHVPRIWWSIGQSCRLISVCYRELGHLLRFETCQPVANYWNGSLVQIFYLSLSRSRLDNDSSRIGQSNFIIIETEPRWENERFRKKPRWAPKTNLSYQNVFLSTTPLPELIGRAKFHYGIIALSESLLSVLPLCRDEVRLSQSLAIAVVSGCIHEFARSTKATNCLLFY